MNGIVMSTIEIIEPQKIRNFKIIKFEIDVARTAVHESQDG